MISKQPLYAAFLALSAILLLGACTPATEDNYDPTSSTHERAYLPEDSIFGSDGLSLGRRAKDDDTGASGGIGVNAFLWRASLDTISFMPVTSADPFGGVILTDWYSAKEEPNERYKVNIYILDRQLRADGIRVSVFRQKFSPIKQWQDVEVSEQTAIDLENTILTRARQMRVNQMASEK